MSSREGPIDFAKQIALTKDRLSPRDTIFFKRNESNTVPSADTSDE